MSNLDNLVSKIIKDCEAQAKQITAAANAEAAAVISRNTAAAEKEKETILAGAALEAEKTAERITLSKRLEIRDENLNAKRKTINKVFNLALDKLNNMPRDQYMKFLTGSLSAMDAASGEIILPSRYGVKAEELNTGLSIHTGGRHINGGFILVNEGIEYNFTFETLLEYRRYELESEIIKILF